MPRTVIKNAHALMPDGWRSDSTVAFDREIVGVNAGGAVTAETEASVVDAEGSRVTAGLIDLHTHGIGRFAFERSAEDLAQGLALLPSFGVTTVLPTLYRVLSPRSFATLEMLGKVLGSDNGVRTPGFHFEGPFLAIAGAGALTLDGDVKLLDDLIASVGGRVAAMSISPEVRGIVPVIERAVERGIKVFMTHTCASVDQTQAAIDAGARHATHFYDVFPVPPEADAGVRPVGAVETILADDRVTIDFICDGVHVHPAAVRMALAAKGEPGVLAISDANVGAGLPPGEYETPWGYRVSIKAGDAARIADRNHPHFGALAGSGLTMSRAVANLRKWLPKSDTTPWRMATRNPARVMGLSDRGDIAAGSAADLVQWGDDHRPLRTWVAGRCVFERDAGA